MRIKIYHLPQPVFVCVVLNAITFLLYVFKGDPSSHNELINYKNIFVATVILTALSIVYVGLSESWKLVKEFHQKKQKMLMTGQLVISMVVIVLGYFVVYSLIKFMINKP